MYWIVSIAAAVISPVLMQLFRFWLRMQQFKRLRRVLSAQANWYHLLSYFFLPGHADKPSRLAVRPSISLKHEGDTEGDKPTLRAYLHSAEVEQLKELMSVVAPFPIDLKLLTSEAIGAEENNLLIIGGDYHNATAAGLMRRLNRLGVELVPGQLGVDHGHYAYKDRKFGCKLKEIRGAANKRLTIVTRDSGLIFRCRTDVGSEVLMGQGIHMHGSGAALATALSAEFQAEVARRGLVEFFQFVEVDDLADGISVDWRNITWEPALLIDARLRPQNATDAVA